MRSDRVLFGSLIGSISIACVIAACAPSRSGQGDEADGPGGGEAGAGGSGNTDGGAGYAGQVDLEDEEDAGEETLRIEPADPIVQTDGTPTTLQLTAKTTKGEPSSVVWLIDDVVVGTISQDGLFTAKGLVAGKAKVTARFGTLEASTTVTVKVKASQSFVDTLTTEDQDALRAGGSSDAGFRWLYPYDKTVFPRGLAAPVLQFGGAGADVVRVVLSVGDSEWEGFFPGSYPLQVTIPQNAWEAVTLSASATDSVNVSVTKIASGQVTGPVTQSYRIAQGKLKGSIYYNSYNSALAGGGAILRVRAGHDAEVVRGGCAVCHSVSANGNRIATGLNWSDTQTVTGTGNPIESGTLELDANGEVTSLWTDSDGRKFSFGGLTPDGAYVLSNAVAPSNQIRGLSGTMLSKLWDAATGAEVYAPSFTDQVKYAVTPQFSPDGKKVAFSWYRDGNAQNGKVIATMTFDGTKSPPEFGTVEEVVTSSTIIGWPSFTPDGEALLYHEGDRFDTEGSFAELRLVDLNTGEVSQLETLNGWSSGTFYLPYGQSEEARLNYEPTVLPVAVGGYYWVVFTSRRAYGNEIAPGGKSSPDRFVQNSARKKLWVAAIDMTGAPGEDRSHPPFYLPGQELTAGNMRGFAALDPCKAEGEGCDSAAECCGGYCRQTGADEEGAPVFQCVPPPSGCSQEDERCTTVADCCDAPNGYQCINGHCARPSPPH